MVNDTVLDLGVILLESAAEELEEVIVVAEKPMVQVLADRTVFNVENTLNATGTSAFELLRKAPGGWWTMLVGLSLRVRPGFKFL